MVLTRLSHIGEVCPYNMSLTQQNDVGETCPLSDHSYSDSHSSSFNTDSEFASTSGHQVIACKIGNNETNEKDKCRPELHKRITAHILALPNEILEKIFYNFSYKSIGDLRCVCKRFNTISGNILNTAFLRLQTQMLGRFQETKSLMPRRESARRKHPLARESDILEILHMRLNLLQMTFGKHIERKNCCFFAGEILDEVLRILRNVKLGPNTGKVFKVTDELFDLTTMAMEYFKEFIEPALPEISYLQPNFTDNHYSESDEDEPDPVPHSSMVLRKRIIKIRQGMRRYNSQLTNMKRDLRNYKNRIAEQNKLMAEYTARMEAYDRKFDEASRKFNTVLQELNRCKTELQYWRSRTPIQNVVCCNCCTKSHSGELSKDMNSPPLNHFMGPPRFAADYNPGMKNLQPLFDCYEEVPPSTSDLSAPSTSFSSDPGSSSETKPSDSSITPDDNSTSKRIFSNDDDSDDGVETVGSRVKGRKRIKLH